MDFFWEEGVDEEFESVPGWLKEAAGANDILLPWLPISPDELDSTTFLGNDDDSLDFSQARWTEWRRRVE
jgi:hypothetical protein